MAYTTINKSTDYFNTKLYTGTGSSNSVTGVGFQPDFTWVKARGNTTWNYLYDAVRTAGTGKNYILIVQHQRVLLIVHFMVI